MVEVVEQIGSKTKSNGSSINPSPGAKRIRRGPPALPEDRQTTEEPGQHIQNRIPAGLSDQMHLAVTVPRQLQQDQILRLRGLSNQTQEDFLRKLRPSGRLLAEIRRRSSSSYLYCFSDGSYGSSVEIESLVWKVLYPELTGFHQRLSLEVSRYWSFAFLVNECAAVVPIMCGLTTTSLMFRGKVLLL